MYCPSCGSHNADSTKYCTRCGTNLAAVTQALAGKPEDDGLRLDAWTAKLLRKYYSGRRDTVFGAGMIAGGLLIMALLAKLAGLPPKASFWIVCWMFIWGVISLAHGLGKWTASSGEMNKLGLNTPQPALPRAATVLQDPSPPDRPKAASITYSTDPINIPASVTEQTTRHLEDQKPIPVDGRSKQTN